MVLRRRDSVLCVMGLGLGLLIWSLWAARAFVPSVRLPEGVSLAEALHNGSSESPKGWHTNVYCQEGRPAVAVGLVNQAMLVVDRILYGTHEMLGRSLCKAPNPPVVDFVTPRLGECFQTSGEKYLLAKEIYWEVSDPPQQQPGYESTFLSFVWGGTNQPRNARDRVVLIEDGILKNGIFGMRLAPEYFRTNRCVVIRDTRRLVKIVPLDYLKAYVDAGLVRLPN
jgi:hypothetical protein